MSYKRLAAFALALAAAACGGGAPAPAPPTADPFGMAERIEVEGLRFPVAPAPPTAVQAVRAFPQLSFASPVHLTHAPDGTDRIFVVELDGRVRVFANDDTVAATRTFLDLSGRVRRSGPSEGLVGLAFDPRYADNGFFYVMYSASNPRRSVLARFRVSASDPDAADAASEVVLLEVAQPSREHNGACVAFGADGMLYAGFGDGGGQGDPYGNGQDATNLLATIIRIDPHGGTPYAIPPDNPFAGRTDGTRGEIWAYGVRSPWRFSFDRATGDLWLGDVGQYELEEVDVVVRGGNYGWPVYEGSETYAGGTGSFEFPVHEYGRSGGNAVIGGVVYRGQRAPALAGAYVYGDHGSGDVWALRWDGRDVTSHERIASVDRVCSFGEDRDGEVYAVSHGGAVYRFEQSGGGGGELPAKLSETGLFTDTVGLVPAAGLIEYDVNAALWSDGARKRRWIALPGAGTIGFDATGAWSFPVGTVLVKHFELDLGPGRVQRLETRVLVHESAGWAGYTYRWNFLQSDADLLPGGASQTFTVADPLAPGGEREQTWDFPSRAQCQLCHTAAAGRVLGVNTRQLNRDFAYAEATDNQLRAWNHIGLFGADIGAAGTYAALADPADATRPLADRVRAYLDANCAQCHRPDGPASVEIDLRHATPLHATGLVDARPTEGDLGLADAWRVRPGAKESSVLWERLRRLDGTRMPDVGSSVVDGAAVDLIGRWIDQGAAER